VSAGELGESAGIGLDTGLDCGAMVTDQSDRASPHPAVMVYVVGGDARDVTWVVMLFVSCWGFACRQLAVGALFLQWQRHV